MTNELKNQIKEALQKELEGGKTSQNKLAVKCDVSSGMLSHIANDAWENIGEKTWLKLAAYFKIADRWAIHKTNNFNTIQNLCADTQEVKRMVAVSAFSGAGKTAALQYFAAKNKNVIYVMCNFFMSKKSLLNAILKQAGLLPCGNAPEALQLLKEFILENQDVLIILDDCGKLNDGCFRTIQLIYDETEFSCGMVLSGTEFLKKHFEKMVAKDKMGFRELYRRIGYWQGLKEPNADIINQILEFNGISADKQLLAAICTKAKNYGALRAIITNAKKLKEPLDTTNLSHMAIGSYEYTA